MKEERKPKSLIRNKKAQMGTIMTIITGSITVLLGVVIFVSVFHAMPEVGPTINNESWAFNTSDSGTYTKQLNYTNVIEDSEKVYNVSTGAVKAKDTDYNITYATGVLINITAWTNGTYGVDYKYEEAGVVTTKATIATIFFSAMGLVIIGFLVLGAIFILGVVSLLRGAGRD